MSVANSQRKKSNVNEVKANPQSRNTSHANSRKVSQASAKKSSKSASKTASSSGKNASSRTGSRNSRISKSSSQSKRPTVIRGQQNLNKSTPVRDKEIEAALLKKNVSQQNVAQQNVSQQNVESTDLFQSDASSAKDAALAKRWRQGSIALISAGLIFAIGVEVGSRSSEALVDNSIETILNTGAKELDRKVLERAAIEGVLKATGDEWANYFPKSALQVLREQSSSMFTGVGVWLNKSRGGQVKISSIQAGSPAANANLLVGDQVLEVNGTDVRGASLTSVTALIRGAVGKRIELLVSRDDKKVLANLSTKKVSVRTVSASQVSDGIAFIEIASFTLGTAQDVSAAIKNLDIESGIILDLRNNPGGLIEEAVKVAEIFIEKGVIVSYQVNGSERLFKATNPSPVTVPVIVMINRNTASSAEILAGAFQDRNRGVIVGERSYGKGSVQEFVTLEDGSKIELTVALYRTPSGRIIDEVGITPDLEVPSSEIGEKALQVLGGLASLIAKK
jgi:carboxyl-terminal processing protease